MELPQQKLFNIYSRGKLWKQFGILTVFWNNPTNLPTLFFPRGNVNLTICSGRGCHARGCMTSMKAPTGKGDKALLPPKAAKAG